MEVLNNKQLSFINHYRKNGGNGTKAAVSAGYSESTADQCASRLLKNRKIATRIMQVNQIANDISHIDAAWLLYEYANLYKECLQEGDRHVAKGCLDSIGKHVNVQAFEPEKGQAINISVDDSKWTIEVVHANQEDRLIAQAADVDVIEHDGVEKHAAD